MNIFMSNLLLGFSCAVCNQIELPDEFKSLSLENISSEDFEYSFGKLSLENPTFLYMSTTDLHKFEDFYQNKLLELFPYTYVDNSKKDLAILSKIKLDHLEIYKIDEDNYIIETASDALSQTTFWGHLPHLNYNQIETLKSYLIATNPYLLKRMAGDLTLENRFDITTLELCNKQDYGVQGKADTGGNKSIKADYQIKSDDDRFSFKTEVSAKENSKGEKKGEVVFEIRANH